MLFGLRKANNLRRDLHSPSSPRRPPSLLDKPQERERQHHPRRVRGRGAASLAQVGGRLGGERPEGRREEEPPRGFHPI